MIKWKNIVASFMAMLMIMSITACGNTGDAQGGQASAENGKETEEKTPEQLASEKWAEDNGLNKTETVDELYEAAKKEGKVVVYSLASRIKKVKESFEKQYPGVEVEAYNISQSELLEKVSREYESGLRNADVVHVKDQVGNIYYNFTVPGIFHNYYPKDICNTIDPALLKTCTPLYYEMTWWFYNDEVNPNGPPISSWWDLTKPEWKGKFFYTDPLSNESYMAALAAFTKEDNAKLMADDYKRVFGEEIKLSEGCENAGYEFIKRFAANQPILESAGAKTVQSIGTKGQKTAPVGYAASSKIREREDQGYALQPVTEITPTVGIYGLNQLSIVNEAPHPAAAKLLVRWMMGEADGKGAGFEPFNTLGGWPVRSNVKPAAGSIPLEKIKVFPTDLSYMYNNFQKVSDFWLSVQ